MLRQNDCRKLDLLGSFQELARRQRRTFHPGVADHPVGRDRRQGGRDDFIDTVRHQVKKRTAVGLRRVGMSDSCRFAGRQLFELLRAAVKSDLSSQGLEQELPGMLRPLEKRVGHCLAIQRQMRFRIAVARGLLVIAQGEQILAGVAQGVGAAVIGMASSGIDEQRAGEVVDGQVRAGELLIGETAIVERGRAGGRRQLHQPQAAE